MEHPTISNSGFIWIKFLPLKITLAKLTGKQLVGSTYQDKSVALLTPQLQS